MKKDLDNNVADTMADVEIDLEISDPKELMGLGLRAFAIRDFSSSAAALGKATQLMAQEHGDEHDSLGEVYLHYARALLEVSREEAEPLGDAIPHGDSDASDSSREDDDEEQKSSAVQRPSAAVNGEASEGGVEKDKGDIPSSSSPAAMAARALNGEGSSAKDASEQPEEECSDLQLAWEVLEVARRIFAARGPAGRESLAQTLILLGEVGMESENFTDGIKDIGAGLEIQEALYEDSSRRLAETYYKLGTAHCTHSNIEEAVRYFRLSIGALDKRIALLQEAAGSEEARSEIEEIRALLPKIEEKIVDTKLIKEDAVKMLMDALNIPKSEGGEPSSSRGAATDISHLVKRKRRPEETPEPADDTAQPPAKKPTP